MSAPKVNSIRFQQEARNSSEYSKDGIKKSTKIEDEIPTDEKDKKQAKSHLYSIIFGYSLTYVVLLPSILIGCSPIIMYFLLGEVLNALSRWTINNKYGNNDSFDAMGRIMTMIYGFIGLAVGTFIMKFLDSFCWIRIGSYLSVKVRKDLFNNMMKSEISFFDVTSIGGILTILSEDAQSVQDAFGTFKGTQIQSITQFLSSIIISFIYSWKLALISMCCLPGLLIIMIILGPSMMKNAKLSFQYVAESITIAEEALAAIRTVQGFNQEKHEIERFAGSTKKASHHENIFGIFMMIMLSMCMIIIWGICLGNLYYGARLVEKKELLAGDLFSVFGFSMMGCFGLLMIGGSMKSEGKAISAGARILKLSNHIPNIPFDGGRIIDKFEGHIEFRNVSFKYPTRDVYVLKNVSFEIKAGQTGALVGHSGSGKSTCVQLLERFYDVTDGFILLDGIDIRELNPRWLHTQISLVSQEPTLFQKSIKENILYGVDPNTKDEEISHAIETANCKKFISKLTEGIETNVGEKGSSLSGGQRQRIAIARAIIKKPVILITDEATSALDAGSEKKVQNALDKVMINLTGVVVAHRLSTIRNANIIYVFDAGEIKEVGTHDSLIAIKGEYFKLVQRQLVNDEAK
jgi:ABC-type multidrug transport system fused ATPase/permease subunit